MHPSIPIPGPYLERPDGRLDFKVDQVKAAPSGCRALAQVGFIEPDVNGFGAMFHYELDSETPLPLRVVADFYHNISSQEPRPTGHMELVLQRFTPGIGPEVPSFQPNPPWPPTGLERFPLVDGFLADRDIGTPTSYDEAVSAMRADDQAGAWLSEHPDAIPASVSHEGHLPTSAMSLTQPIDAWAITWVDPAGNSLAVRAQKEAYSAPLLPPTIQVSESEPDLPPSFPDEAVGPSLAQMLGIARKFYGSDRLNLTCNLVASTCAFDPADGNESVQLGFGLVFWLKHGWVVQESSAHASSLGEPLRSGQTAMVLI